jgi:UDP-N-acetylmuramoyl-tripeptide--D-alanyl-D-alanine ligase
VGLNDGLTWQEIFDGLHESQAQLRLVVARAESGALILDDTYNASPESTLAALNLLDEMDGRRIAVLGDMLELGQYEQEGHWLVGARAAEVVDRLVTVGQRGKLIAHAAAMSGLTEDSILIFENNRQAITYLRKHLEPQDIVLVKGSRGMQMEFIVSALEADQ